MSGLSPYRDHPMDGETVVEVESTPVIQCGVEVFPFPACPKCGHGAGYGRALAAEGHIRCQCGVILKIKRKAA